MNSVQTVMNNTQTVHCLLKAFARESNKKGENANVKCRSKHGSKQIINS